MTQTLTTEQYTEGLCVDGAAILCDGVPMSVSEILAVLNTAANREAQSVTTSKFAGWGLYHAGRDDFGSWLKHRPEDESGDAITKHGYVNVKLFTAPPAPAVPPEASPDDIPQEHNINTYSGITWAASWNACRAAMLAETPPAPAIAIPEKVSCEGFNPKDWVEARNLGQREGWNAYRAAMLAATPPALRDGYCIMPQALTAENGAKYALSGEFKVSRTVTCNECGGDGCNDCGDAGEFEEEITVPWDTIKEIYRAAVNVCAQPNAAAKDDK